MHDQSGTCRFMNLPRTYSLEELAKFHGHLGPYIVLGYRIGKYARESFCSDPFAINAVIRCSGKPPESCLIDGVQLGSGCTFGKQNIAVMPGPEVRCEFTAKGKTLIVTLASETTIRERAHDESEVERFAEELYLRTDAELFSARIG